MRRWLSQSGALVLLLAGCSPLLLVNSPLSFSNSSLLKDNGSAQTLNESVVLKAWIEPSEAIVARQQVNFFIEVSTDSFFSGGTRIDEFEVPGAIVLRREQLAVNSSRREGGRSWAVQRWKIALYPQRGGRFDVPDIDVRVVVGSGESRAEKVLRLRAFGFEAIVPESMADVAAWIATNEFEVRESYDIDEDLLAGEVSAGGISVGDTVTREIRLTANDAAAMMLPQLHFTAGDGLAVYEKPPRLSNSVNRGVYRAQRIETVTYFIEQQGTFELSELAISWWDTQARERRDVILPARTISTLAGPPGGAEVAVGALKPRSQLDGWVIAYLVGGIAGFGLLAFAWLRWGKSASRKKTGAGLDERLDAAVRKQDSEVLIGLLYESLDAKVGGPDGEFSGVLRRYVETLNQEELAAALDAVMQAGYGADAGKEPSSRDGIPREILSKARQIAEARPKRPRMKRPLLELN